ncbi:F-box/LRR-repeat protein [Striga asiatica]|uniref:F-box/LRR-repeat protein n=1 Tax=Striga asiatica TaxID=4170 RepID=A0A5A7QGS2_STRAF|nr:F-box/LRR-repeat protein [Striga asiatica]
MEDQSRGSLRKLAKARAGFITEIDDLGDDLMQNILSRLPALYFAWAACVSRSWNALCNRILSSPKLSSAVSFNSSLENAVNEVMDKVLSEPIRPHFALASIGPHFSLQSALELIDAKLGSSIPVIVNVSEGIIGKDAHTEQFVEVLWEVTEEQEGQPPEETNRGIILTVGFLPGLKALIVPLLCRKKVKSYNGLSLVVIRCTQEQGPQGHLIDDFVMSIREVASAVSDSAVPAGVILFADRKANVKLILQKIDYAFPEDTFVVGDGGSPFLYRCHRRSDNTSLPDSICAAVSLVFARDRNKPLGVGETQFHTMFSAGISPVGNTYKAVCAKCIKSSTWLTASRETVRNPLDGQAILDEIYDELGDRIQYPAFYIGVTKRRKCSVRMERVRQMQFLEFHEVLGGDEEYLFANSVGITTTDPFRFYISDSKLALSSCNKVGDELRELKMDCEKRRVFGGIIFSCCGRGESFFRSAGVDSAPFISNFPGVAFGGSYCAGEIGRAKSSLYGGDSEVSCSEHVYSAIYLVMSYCPPPQLE